MQHNNTYVVKAAQYKVFGTAPSLYYIYVQKCLCAAARDNECHLCFAKTKKIYIFKAMSHMYDMANDFICFSYISLPPLYLYYVRLSMRSHIKFTFCNRD